MKVYVVTKALPLQEEVYVSVHPSIKAAEKSIRKDFPNARKDDSLTLTSFLCIGPYDDKDKLFGKKQQFLMFIREEELA